MIGLADHQRRDEALYDDFETVKAREVCKQWFLSHLDGILIYIFCWLFDI